MYIPIEQEPFGAMTVVLRTGATDPTTVIPAARRALAATDPSLPLSKIQTRAEVVGQSGRPPRLISSLASLFGVLAGILAAVGVRRHGLQRPARASGLRHPSRARCPSRSRTPAHRRSRSSTGRLWASSWARSAPCFSRGRCRRCWAPVHPNDPLVFAITGVRAAVRGGRGVLSTRASGVANRSADRPAVGVIHWRVQPVAHRAAASRPPTGHSTEFRDRGVDVPQRSRVSVSGQVPSSPELRRVACRRTPGAHRNRPEGRS